MKINLIEYIQKVATHVSLSASEREKMENVVTEYMKMKPLTTVSSASLVRHGSVRGNLFSYVAFITNKKYMPIAIIIALLLSGGVSYAAEGSMPGDVLYPVKVHVNENVGGAFALSPEAKAVFEAKLAERRITEATNLSAEHKLTLEQKKKLESDFAEHADLALAHTKDLEDKDSAVAIDLSSKFESNLFAHEAILADLNAKGDVEDFVNSVHAKALLVGKVRTDVENKAGVQAQHSEDASTQNDSSTVAHADSGVQKEVALATGVSAKRAISDTSTLLNNSTSANLNASAVANARAQIDSASMLVAQGDALIIKNDFVAAFHLYQNALVRVKRLAVYINASNNLKINISVPDDTRKSSDDMKQSREDAQSSSEGGVKTDDSSDDSVRDGGEDSNDLKVEVHTGSVNLDSESKVHVGL